jgi:hypothetical protein
MSDLAGHAMRAPVQPTIYNQSGGNTRADAYVCHTFCVAGLPGTGPVCGAAVKANRSEAHVVLEHARHAQQRRQMRPRRDLLPPKIHRLPDNTRAGVHAPWHPDAYGRQVSYLQVSRHRALVDCLRYSV